MHFESRYLRSVSRARDLNTILSSDSTTAPQNARQKPRTAKPETKFEANRVVVQLLAF